MADTDVKTGVLTIIGIDPGLVHTGVVIMQFRPDWSLHVQEHVFAGDKSMDVVPLVKRYHDAYIFIEAYRPRGNIYKQDERMRKLVNDLNSAIRRGKIVDNTGVKHVVSQELMEVFDVWTFSQKTHHQDLRSAARIAIYGALKDMELNQVLFDYAQHKLGL